MTQSELFGSIPLSQRVWAIFDAAFSLLEREGYRHEYIYKAALAHKIRLGKHSLHTASMINEFRLYNEMLAIYPERVNPAVLWYSAQAVKSRT